MNRTLLDLTRCLLHHKNLPLHFWGEAAITAVYIRNRVLTRGLSPQTTPYHRWYGHAPNVSHLRVFGSECWYVVPKRKIKKLNPRSRKAMMMGYSSQSKTYKLWDIELEKLITSRDVHFVEEGKPTFAETHMTVDQPEMQHEISFPSSTAKVQDESNVTESESEVDKGIETESNHSETQELAIPNTQNLRRSTRKRNPTGEWWKASSTDSNVYTNDSEKALIADSSVPSSYFDATSPAHVDFWLPGFRKEENSLCSNGTFTIVDRIPRIKVVPCRHVFPIKNGLPKVRIVAKGFRQIHGVNCWKLYFELLNFLFMFRI